MRNTIMIIAYIIVGFIFLIVIANENWNSVCQKVEYISYLGAAANIGVFITSVIAGIYAIVQYENHKKEEHTKLLCEYNKRYSTECYITTMLEWMLKVGETNNNGDIVDVNLNKSYIKPGINTKELFMRFFEELHLQIADNNLNPEEVYDYFAYYVLLFDEFNEYHQDITDYVSRKDLERMDKSEKKAVNENWKRFSDFVCMMHDIKEARQNN